MRDRRLRRAAVLAYPNTVPETYCIAAREALAAGCAVVSSAFGALPETTAGFVRLLPLPADRRTYLERFAMETVEALKALGEQDEALRRQVAQVLGESTWDRWAERWADCLARLWLRGLQGSVADTACSERPCPLQ